MITYENFWVTLAEKGETWYSLTKKYHLSDNLLHRLRHNLPVNVNTLDRLCSILDCTLPDIATYHKDPKPPIIEQS
ncbi:MAG: helix-turn-helix transcriptional regulator [Lachnospiraceae bacterium]|nr:helix-turn-helix transcriptional regulator [Lachnospiraceae bacterium]